MFRVVVLLACLVACSAHAVLPLAHTVVAPAPYPHGLGLGLAGYAGHGFADHGYSSVGHVGYASQGPIGHGYDSLGLLGHGHGAHHILKRSPHFVPVGHLGGIEHGGYGAYPGHLSGVGHLGVVGHLGATGHEALIAPVAVSHQSRVDVRSSPAHVVTQVLPVVAPVPAPLIHAAPIQHAAPLHYGGGHYGSAYSHLGHY